MTRKPGPHLCRALGELSGAHLNLDHWHSVVLPTALIPGAMISLRSRDPRGQRRTQKRAVVCGHHAVAHRVVRSPALATGLFLWCNLHPTVIRLRLDAAGFSVCYGPAGRRRKRAIATLGGMVGALTLARAVDDPALSKEILAAARDVLGEARPARERCCPTSRRSGMPDVRQGIASRRAPRQ